MSLVRQALSAAITYRFINSAIFYDSAKHICRHEMLVCKSLCFLGYKIAKYYILFSFTLRLRMHSALCYPWVPWHPHNSVIGGGTVGVGLVWRTCLGELDLFLWFWIFRDTDISDWAFILPETQSYIILQDHQGKQYQVSTSEDKQRVQAVE